MKMASGSIIRSVMFVLLIFSIILAAACSTALLGKDISYTAHVDEAYFYLSDSNEKLFLKGVNLGMADPGHFPGEHAITREQYLDWFEKIGAMNANTIRIYTVHPPEFYTALLDFNLNREKPLYLLHGVWLEEELIASTPNGNDPEVMSRFKVNARQVADVVHGAASLPARPGYSDGVYGADISDYVIGYVLGIEWSPDFILGTDGASAKPYNGKYLFNTPDASSFESFLASVGDDLIGYETKTYGHQTPVSFTNWVTADPLKHPNEPFESEDAASVDMEHIKTTKAFIPGFFASYHVYPYYPESLVHQKEYREYKDLSGKINTYAPYLKELRKHHTMPVIVAEFGIPASRGLSHQNIYTGFNQGNTSEKVQGEQLVSMMADIRDNGYAGGIAFTWQDEWFKRTWNTSQLNDPDRRPFWNDVMTNEQNFGLLAFENADPNKLCRTDGLIDDWGTIKPSGLIDGNPVYVKNDEKYLYLMFSALGYTEKDRLLIAIDSLKGQGNTLVGETGLSLNLPAEFLIEIAGEDDSSVTVDSYYDVFTHYYAPKPFYKGPAPVIQKNTGQFSPIRLCLNYGMTLPLDGTVYPFSSYDSGKLRFGNGNPAAEDYDSLSDFIIKDGVVEVRIPYQLLGIADPSSKRVIGDVASGEITMVPLEGLRIEAIWQKPDGTAPIRSEIFEYDWEPWDQQVYNSRLKQSYFILKDYYKTLD